MKGQGGGGTARGGGKLRGGGGSVLITKTKARQTVTINDSIMTLRSAIFASSGQDKDVLSSISPAFLSYKRNGLDVVISLQFSLSKDDLNWFFHEIKSNMEDIYDESGYGWDDDDKLMELNEDGKRYLVIREATTDQSRGRLLGVVHFRFTVQGEVLDQMIGEAMLTVSDIHLDPSIRRKGLGRHLMTILELIARKENMAMIGIPIQSSDEETRLWLDKCRGYQPDSSLPLLGFESSEEGFDVYVKRFVNVKALTPTSNVTKETSKSVGAVSTIKEATIETSLSSLSLNDDNVSQKVLSADDMSDSATTISSNLTTPMKGELSNDIEGVSHDGIDHLSESILPEDEASIDLTCIDENEIINQLKTMYIESNGKEPTNEELEQWLTTLREAKEENSL